MQYEILHEEYAQVLNESVPRRNETHGHLDHVGIKLTGGVFRSETPEHESKVKALHQRLKDHGYSGGSTGDHSVAFNHVKVYSKEGHHSVEINDRPSLTGYHNKAPSKVPLSTVKTYKPS